jgi:two-component system, NtrC family, sensor histidine kinase HydH
VTLSTWIGLVGCTGHLALAILVALRGGRNPLALPLILLSLDLFGWNAAELAYSLSREPAWHWLDTGLSPFTPPLALHVIAVFVGRARALRGFLAGSYGVFSLLAFSSMAAFLWPTFRTWTDSEAWSIAYLLGELPVLGVALHLLVSHQRRAAGVEEQLRARVMLIALAIGVVLGATEFMDDLGVHVPPLGSLATLVTTALVTVVALRLRLFARDLSAAIVVYAFALSVLGVLLYLLIFAWLGTSRAALVVGTTVVTLGLIAITREAVGSVSAKRHRAEHLATLGRFSAQMGHDLKNPLAALKGALQFLVEEETRGHSLQEHGQFLQLMSTQVERMGRVIDDYQRLGRVEVERREVRPSELVEAVLALQTLAPPPNVVIRTAFSEPVSVCAIDTDLFSGALENLVRNGIEAMPDGGTLTVKVEPVKEDRGVGLVLSVEDTGTGMDVREAAQAFDDFYTTKASGSGLGLAFVRRVAHAHGGRVDLSSEPGRGTVVSLYLPAP